MGKLGHFDRALLGPCNAIAHICTMTTITFDTHKFVRRLKEPGFDEKQAEALTDALQAAIADSDIVTRKDLQIELAPLKFDLQLAKWMLGLLLAGVLSLVVKSFF